MEPWGVWLCPPRPRSIPGGRQGKGPDGSEILRLLANWALEAPAHPRARSVGPAGEGRSRRRECSCPPSPPARACSLRDQDPPEGQPTPSEETHRGKRSRPQQVLIGTRPQGEEACRAGQYLFSG